MNEVNKTLFIPLYGKSLVSKKEIIIKDPSAELIWQKEGFSLKGKSKSKWLAYNMAMRAAIFDAWTDSLLRTYQGELSQEVTVLHIGCGLDSRYLRVKEPYTNWIDADFPEVLAVREKYFKASETYHMVPLDASDSKQLKQLPEGAIAIVILEGLSMYLTNEETATLFQILDEKFSTIHILMDVYTTFGAKASKYKNPVNAVGVSTLYGIDNIHNLIKETGLLFKAEHSFTPDNLVNQLKPVEQTFFKIVFSKKLYRSLYRLYELEKKAFSSNTKRVLN